MGNVDATHTASDRNDVIHLAVVVPLSQNRMRCARRVCQINGIGSGCSKFEVQTLCLAAARLVLFPVPI
jgi:hypothetical protein